MTLPFIRPGRFEELVGIMRHTCASGALPTLTANSEPSGPAEPVVRGCWNGFQLWLEFPGQPDRSRIISEHQTLTGAARALTVAKAALA